MISTSALLAYLAKAGKGNNRQEDGDTKLKVPGTLNLTIESVFPPYSFFSTPQGNLAPVNSWIYSERVPYVVTGATFLIALGPGLWDVEMDLNAIALGAVADKTQSYRIELSDQGLDGAGLTITLGFITGDMPASPIQHFKARMCVPAGSLFVFNRLILQGLGTGTNNAFCRINATRLL